MELEYNLLIKGKGKSRSINITRVWMDGQMRKDTRAKGVRVG